MLFRSYCLASTAKRDGLRLISVVLGTPEPRSHFRETIKIFNYGFSRFESVNFAEKGAKLDTVKVDKGVIDQVGVVAGEEIAVAIPKGQKKKIRGEKDISGGVKAPVHKGQKVGEFVVKLDGQELQKFPLLAQTSVSKASVFQQMYKVMNKAFAVK